MLDILAITGPIFITILLGFLTTRAGLFAKADMLVFGRFVFNLALPALLFNALAQREFGEIFNAAYLLAYLAGSLILLVLAYCGSRRWARLDRAASTFHAMGMTCSNSGYVGYPILLLTMAPIAGVVLALNMIVENIFIIPLLLALAERGRGETGPWYSLIGESLLRLGRNPLIIAVVAGLGFSILGLKLPDTLARVVNMFATSSSALSLFVIGGTLSGLSMRGMVRPVSLIALGKLVLHPFAVLLAIVVLQLSGLPISDPSLRTAAVLSAAMPMLGIYPILGQKYGQADLCASALLVTTIASFFTLSSLLWVLKNFPAFS